MIKRFLNYVEIRTKITGIFAFLLALAFLFYSNQSINREVTLIFFGAMFLFDLTTTAINNYIDTKDNGRALPFQRSVALAIIMTLLAIATMLGLILVYRTDIVVLFLGAMCFLCGILYTYGPVPISRQPLGEIFSGVFYGFFIPFILLYINMPEGTYLTLQWNLKTISLELQVLPLITLVLLSVIPACATANIMLANNICDLEQDVRVKRYTLPYYLGKNASLYLFAALYYCTYAVVIVMTAAGFLPMISLLFLLTLIPVQKNINEFFGVQDKEKTFVVAINNYIIIMGSISLLVFLGGFTG